MIISTKEKLRVPGGPLRGDDTGTETWRRSILGEGTASARILKQDKAGCV